MGFLNKLFGGGDSAKEDLIKNLAKERVRADPAASRMGFDESMIDSLDTMQLMGIPEAAIVTIVETYAQSLKTGASERVILEHIENHRSQIGSGTLPEPLNLESYVNYRLEVEHGHGAPISEDFINKAIATCKRHFGI